jgi:hypothetical protein
MAAAQRSVGNRAIAHARLQRCPRPPAGVIREYTLAAGTTLYHGTTAAEFTHEHLDAAGPSPVHYQHPPVPDAPAWFAENPLFSMHAGFAVIPAGRRMRMWLHQYRVRRDLRLLRFSDLAELSTVLIEQEREPGRPDPEPVRTNDVPAALRWQRLAGPMDGYRVDADVVRREPEIVLFPSGTQAMTWVAHFELLAEPAGERVPPGGEEPVPSHRLTMGGGGMGDYYHTAGAGTFV